MAGALQFEALRFIPAAAAQPFYALQPLFAAGWGWLVLHEPLPPSALGCGAVMVGAAVLASGDDAAVTN